MNHAPLRRGFHFWLRIYIPAKRVSTLAFLMSRIGTFTKRPKAQAKMRRYAVFKCPNCGYLKILIVAQRLFTRRNAEKAAAHSPTGNRHRPNPNTRFSASDTDSTICRSVANLSWLASSSLASLSSAFAMLLLTRLRVHPRFLDCCCIDP